MSNDSNDAQNWGSMPILMFTFKRGEVTWRYWNQDEDVQINGATWIGLSTPIKMSGNQQTGDPTQDAILFTIPADLPIAQLFTDLATSGGITAQVDRTFEGHLNDIRPYWTGTITDRKMKDPATFELTGQILSYTGNTQGSRLREGRGCPYQLYQQFNTCMVKKELYIHETTLDDMDGVSITVASRLPPPHENAYAGGFVEFTYAEGIEEVRGIVLQDGPMLQLLGGTAGMQLDTVVRIYPGCPRDWYSCGFLYNNQVNYGGDPVLPGISPFSTSIFK